MTTSVGGTGGAIGSAGTAGISGMMGITCGGTGGMSTITCAGAAIPGITTVSEPKRLGNTPSCSAGMRDNTGSASTPTKAASHTRWRAPAVLRRRLNVAKTAAMRRNVAFARKRASGPAPENGMSLSPTHASFLDALAQLFDFVCGQLRVGHAQHGGDGLLG